MIYNIYTDGGSKPNPGFGACAIVVVVDDSIVFEKAYKKPDTTNNRMELSAMILALGYIRDKLKEEDIVTVHSDSEYVHKGIMQWMMNWKRNNWKTSKKTDVMNKDLWIRIDDLIVELTILKKQCSFQWVKGHDTSVYNNRADQLCTNVINKNT